MLYVVEVSIVVRFLPVIFNQLFHVLLVASHEDSALNVAKFVFTVCHCNIRFRVEKNA